jgi:hypothetical protein
MTGRCAAIFFGGKRPRTHAFVAAGFSPAAVDFSFFGGRKPRKKSQSVRD